MESVLFVYGGYLDIYVPHHPKKVFLKKIAFKLKLFPFNDSDHTLLKSKQPTSNTSILRVFATTIHSSISIFKIAKITTIRNNHKNRKYVIQTTKYSNVDNGKWITYRILYRKTTENVYIFAFQTNLSNLENAYLFCQSFQSSFP